MDVKLKCFSVGTKKKMLSFSSLILQRSGKQVLETYICDNQATGIADQKVRWDVVRKGR